MGNDNQCAPPKGRPLKPSRVLESEGAEIRKASRLLIPGEKQQEHRRMVFHNFSWARRNENLYKYCDSGWQATGRWALSELGGRKAKIRSTEPLDGPPRQDALFHQWKCQPSCAEVVRIPITQTAVSPCNSMQAIHKIVQRI